MITVVYEVQIQQKAAPEALAITMRQIKNFMKEAKIIVTKLDGLAGAHSDSAQASQRFNNLLKNVGYTADVQLEAADIEREASGLFKRGSWVPINPELLIPREDTRPKRPRRRTHSQERGHRRTTTPQEMGASSPRSPMTPNEGISINVTPRNHGKGKGRQADRGPPEASSLRGMQESLSSNRLDSHNAGDIVASKDARSAQPPGTRFPEGAALKYCIAPGASDDYEEVNGQVSKGRSRNSKSLSRTITARVYPNFSVNAVSRDFVEKLGLEITVLSDECFVEMLSDIGSTQARVNDTVGEVRFVWHTPAHILVVPCTVFEQETVPGVPLALGKPYVQQVEAAGGVVRGESSRTGAAS
ncbi:hypothetical protein V499_01078 [Pseudogymnoascus sp. VKM F-103]|nr:hypothetical protein V499_01078 [Pseudogymnoascus sp. VKM F-103]